MQVLPTKLPEVLLIQPKVFGDSRGYFFETWRESLYREAGIRETFVQDNVSRSARGVVRGLHAQWPYPQGKLVSVLEGEVYDVAVDIRRNSPTHGQWVGELLSAENHRQLYIPPGFAHGFFVRSETALFTYKCTDFYHPETELTVLWNDPDLGIPWGIESPTLSPKDLKGRRLRDFAAHELPQ
jgi:dTDP-4-dehydrorhamnose 3,5-epimerase